MSGYCRFIVLLAALSPVFGRGQVYTLSRLPNPISGDLTGFEINDGGMVVIDGGFDQWIWRPDGSVTQIPKPVGTINPYAYRLRESGRVALTTVVQSTGKYSAELYDPLTGSKLIQALPGAVQSWAFGLSEGGDIIGLCDLSDGSETAFLSHLDGTVVDLGTMVGYSPFIAHDINNNGVATGRADSPTLGTRTLVWSRQAGFVDLGGAPLCLAQRGMYLNDDNVVAAMGVYADLLSRLEIYEPGKEPYVIEGPEKGFVADGINGHGDVAGQHFFSGYNGQRGQLWVYGWPRGKWIEDLLDASGAGWKVTSVFGPNNKGQMAGGGKLNGATKRDPFILTPHSYDLPPQSLSLRLGKAEAGGLGSLGAKDGDSFKVRRAFVPSVVSPAVSFRVSSTPTSDTLYLWLKLWFRTTEPGTLKASLWDVQEERWDVKYPLFAPTGVEWSYAELIAKRRMDHYLDSGGTVTVEVDVYPATFSASFVGEFDQASFEYVPASG